ncbi:MAG: DoxX family protein [Dehalococcoidia bacterium]
MAIFERAFQKRELHDPGFVRMLFSNTYLAPLWALARLYLGYQWLIAGSHKVWGDARWIALPGPDGLALKGFWTNAVAIPAKGKPPISYDWYRTFLNFMLDNGWYHWFAWVIAVGEVAVGIMLIVGVFTGFAALAGATMNFNFMLAGSASINPVLFLIAILVMFSWKVSGWVGLDRWLLPALGTPWEPGSALQGLRKARDPEGRGGITPSFTPPA